MAQRRLARGNGPHGTIARSMERTVHRLPPEHLAVRLGSAVSRSSSGRSHARQAISRSACRQSLRANDNDRPGSHFYRHYHRHRHRHRLGSRHHHYVVSRHNRPVVKHSCHRGEAHDHCHVRPTGDVHHDRNDSPCHNEHHSRVNDSDQPDGEPHDDERHLPAYDVNDPRTAGRRSWCPGSAGMTNSNRGPYGDRAGRSRPVAPRRFALAKNIAASGRETHHPG